MGPFVCTYLSAGPIRPQQLLPDWSQLIVENSVQLQHRAVHAHSLVRAAVNIHILKQFVSGMALS